MANLNLWYVDPRIKCNPCDSLFSQLEILAYDLTAADFFKQFRQMSVRIGMQDRPIASIALAHSSIVVTRNRKDFEQVPGLTIEDWSA